MSNLQVSMILKLIDQVTAPARGVKSALGAIGDTTERVGRSGVNWANQQIAANQARKTALMGEAFAVTALAGSVGAMLKPAIDFERAMDGVGAVANASEQELALMTQTARDLGAKTNWGASEAADGMKFLAMAGFEANEVVAAMPGMLNLASAGQTDLARTSDIASNILSGFKLEADEMIRVADVMTNTFTSSNTDIAMLGETMKYVAPVAQSLGIGLEEVAAMSGKLGDAGIQGSQAGTSLRAMMSRMAAPTKEARRAFAALGVETLDADGNLRDFYTILSEIDAGLEKFGTGEQQDLIAAIAGLEAASAATVLLDQAGSGALQNYAASLAETGSAARVAQRMNDNTAGALKRLQSVSESLAISVGTILLPELVAMLETIQPMVAALQQWADANPELITMIARIVGGLVAFKLASIGVRFALFSMLGPILHVVRAGSWLVMVLPQAAALLLSLLNPVKLVRGALVALRLAVIGTGIGALLVGIAMAGVWIYNNWSGLKEFFVGLWEGFRNALGPAAPLLDGIIAAVSSLWDWLANLLGPLDASASDWNGWGQAVGNAIGSVVVLIAGFPGVIVDALAAGWAAVSNWVSNMWNDLGGSASAAWDGLKSLLLNYTPAGLVFSHWDGISVWAAGMWPDLSGIAGAVWDGLKTLLLNYTPAGLIYSHWDGIADWFAQLWASIPSIDWGALINLEGIQAAWNTMADWLGAAAAGLWDLIPDMPEFDFSFWGEEEIEDPKTLLAAAEAARNLEKQFPELSAAAQTVLGDVQAVLREIVSAVAGLTLTSEGAAITLSIAAGMLSQIDAVRAAAAQIGTVISEAMPGAAKVAVTLPGTPLQGKRDRGGPVMAGRAYLVGERGPEQFIPDVAGMILPTSALAARIDSRPVLASASAPRQMVRQGDTYNLTIAPPPGVDAQDIARLVRAEIERAKRDDRGYMHDGEGLE